MIKIEFKSLNKDGVFIMSIEQPTNTLNNEVELMDYVSSYLRNLQMPYTWFKIIT